MKIYIDTCCYGRPFDDQTQERIAEETTALATIIETCKIIGIPVVGSLVIVAEIAKNSDAEKRQSAQASYNEIITEVIPIDADIIKQSRIYESDANLSGLYGLHLAAAIAAGANVLLTTDDYFVRSVQNKLNVKIKVLNPRTFLLGGLV